MLAEHASDSDVRSRSAELSLRWHVCDAWEPLWHAKYEKLSGWAVPIYIKVLLAYALVYFEQRECIAASDCIRSDSKIMLDRVFSDEATCPQYAFPESPSS